MGKLIIWIVKKMWIFAILATIVFLIQVIIGSKEFDPEFIASMAFGSIISIAFNIIPKLGNKNNEPNNTVTINDIKGEIKNSAPLDKFCTININRESSFVGAAIKYELFLNDKSIGFIKNGSSISTTTNLKKNILSCPMSSCIIAFEVKEDAVNFKFGNNNIKIISGGVVL